MTDSDAGAVNINTATADGAGGSSAADDVAADVPPQYR